MFEKGRKIIGDISETESTRFSSRKNRFLNLSLKNYILCVGDEYNKKDLIPLLLIEMMGKDNLIVATLNDLSQELDYPKTTLSTLLGKLKKKDFIKRVRNGIYMINPSVAFRGNAQDRERLIEKYQKIKVK